MTTEEKRIQVLEEMVAVLVQDKIDKTRIFSDLVQKYPELFLSIHYREYSPVVFTKDLPPPAPSPVFSKCYCAQEQTPQEMMDSMPTIEEDLPYWAEIAIKMMREHEKIRAIKLVRSVNRLMGLADAKRYCDKLQDRFVTY